MSMAGDGNHGAVGQYRDISDAEENTKRFYGKPSLL